MRRALLVSFAALAAGFFGCDAPPPAPSSVTTTTAESSASPPIPHPGMPLSPSAMADQPLPPAATAAAEAPETITAQHLLVAYKGARDAAKTTTRSKVDARKRAEEALAKAKKGDDFTALVKAYSDEPGAAARQGNLGRFKHGAMVKPFSDAAFALKVGEVSEVVETDFGFHVIKRNQ